MKTHTRHGIYYTITIRLLFFLFKKEKERWYYQDELFIFGRSLFRIVYVPDKVYFWRDVYIFGMFWSSKLMFWREAPKKIRDKYPYPNFGYL